MVAQLHIRHIKRYRIEPLRFLQHPIRSDKVKLGRFVDKVFDEPGAGNPIHFHMFPSNPFHDVTPRGKVYCAVALTSSKQVTESDLVHNPTLPALNVSSRASTTSFPFR